MKKFLALALASVMAVSLVACGSTNADTNAGIQCGSYHHCSNCREQQ